MRDIERKGTATIAVYIEERNNGCHFQNLVHHWSRGKSGQFFASLFHSRPSLRTRQKRPRVLLIEPDGACEILKGPLRFFYPAFSSLVSQGPENPKLSISVKEKRDRSKAGPPQSICQMNTEKKEQVTELHIVILLLSSKIEGNIPDCARCQGSLFFFLIRAMRCKCAKHEICSNLDRYKENNMGLLAREYAFLPRSWMPQKSFHFSYANDNEMCMQ